MHVRTLQLLLITACIGLAPAAGRAAEMTVLDLGWRFHLGAAPDRAATPEFDDAAWREVRVPHDWAIGGPFEAQGDGNTGRLPWKNEAWYRRSFVLPAGGSGRRVYLDFDGVMAFPKVYINGHLAGEWDYGYSSFRIDATPHVKWGEDNQVAVHVDTRRWGSRWYPGAGIYRKVTLAVTADVHIGHWGVQVVTASSSQDVTRPDTATIRTTVDNHRDAPLRVTVRQRLLAPDGQPAAAGEAVLDLPPRDSGTATLSLRVAEPLLWDVEHPQLYTLITEIAQDRSVLDSQRIRIGFRHFAFTAADGFHLNGRRVQLYGVNLHHDLGPLGAAFNRRAAQRQLEIMQDMGVNALRTAHNPPAPEVLDLADEMGFVVWDEAFDKYAWTAGRPDLQPPLPEFSRRQLDAMVRRDLNHPSIVVWSIGNEVWADEALEGVNPERVAMMAGFVRDLDRSRPVGMSCHIPALVDGGNFDALDLTGWNYSRRYARYREQYPDRPVLYSESASALSTRGYYDPDLPDRSTDYPDHFQMSSYDLGAAPWSDIADAEFRLMEQDRFVAGEFVWTGFDYLGEPTPFTDPARSSYFGAVDLCGFPKDRFYLYRSHWRQDVPTVHLLPHWNWPDRVGRNVPVFVYTNGDSAELFLNGRSLGLRRKGEVPPRLPNLALRGTATASSSASGQGAAAAADGDLATEWRPQADAGPVWWQIDLGRPQTVAQLSVDTPRKENAYAYAIKASTDGERWTRLRQHPTRPYPLWNGPTRIRHSLEPVEARFLRLLLEEATEDAPLGLKEFMAFSAPVENDYYDVTYDYRLRWNEVTYEPGELRAVAYRDGQVLGEAVTETTGPPATLRLTADRSRIAADGEDLVFITTEALDTAGRPHPLAENLVHFAVDGPASIAAVGNGNPLSFEPFLADRRQLFYGKALLILRPQPGPGGTITVTARSPALQPATVRMESQAVPNP
jgi:beta-galactosidase